MWRYSIATDVIGAVIEKVTGMSLREAVQTLVTDPFHMTDTDFVTVDSERLTAAYANGSEEPRLLHQELELIPFIEGYCWLPTVTQSCESYFCLLIGRSGYGWKYRRFSYFT